MYAVLDCSGGTCCLHLAQSVQIHCVTAPVTMPMGQAFICRKTQGSWQCKLFATYA